MSSKRIVEHRLNSQDFFQVLLAGLKVTGKADDDVHEQDLKIKVPPSKQQIGEDNVWEIRIDYTEVDRQRQKKVGGMRVVAKEGTGATAKPPI